LERRCESDRAGEGEWYSGSSEEGGLCGQSIEDTGVKKIIETGLKVKYSGVGNRQEESSDKYGGGGSESYMFAN